MKKIRNVIGIFAAVALIAGLFVGCTSKKSADKTKYYGTWQGQVNADVVQYLIFDEEGYWSVYIDYISLVEAMKQRPELFTTFEHFINGNLYTGITKCSFEYKADTDYVKYTDNYFVDDSGKMDFEGSTGLFPYTKYSDHTGYPEDAIVDKAEAIFNRALADSKK